MSTTIEENVVKMRFDNSEFDKNVEESNETLDKFKDTIESLPQGVSSAFETAFRSISLGDMINFVAIEGGISGLVENVKGSISSIIPSIEEVAIEANSLFQKLTQIDVIGQINSGGQQRALNIEDAMFRLKGLNLDAETFMNAANYAVKGTAYGLDSAAKVASQLGASGMTVEEDLKQALRAISGVAAMTNSSYDEIGRIFTFAASYGKITSRQLLMLSVRGINATATMAKQMGKTEAEIRTMMSKGQITFKDFASAMDNAFGEHAKKANETFTGSMRNVKAALSRIGADAWTPFMNQMTLVYNRLQEMFDLAKKAIVSSHFYENWTKMLETLSPLFQNYISWIGEALTKSRLVDEIVNMISQSFEFFTKIFTDFMKVNYSGWFTQTFNTIANVVKNVDFVIHNLVSTFEDVFGDYVKNGFNFILLTFTQLSTAVTYTEEDVNQVKEVFTSWWEVLEQIIIAFKEIFGEITRNQVAESIKNLSDSVLEFVKGLKAGSTVSDRFKRVFKGALSVLDVAKDLFKALYTFIKPVFNYIGPVADKVLTIAAKVGDILVNLRDTIKENSTIELFFDKVTSIVSKLKNLILGIGTSFFDAFFGEMGEETSFTDRVFAFIEKIGTVISDAFGNFQINGIDLSPLKNFIVDLYNFGFGKDEIAESEEKIDKAETLLDVISGLIARVKELFLGDTQNLEEGANPGLLDKIHDNAIELLEWLKGLAEDLSKNSDLGDVGLLVAGSLGSIALVLDSIAGIINAEAHLLSKVALIIGADGLSKLLQRRQELRAEMGKGTIEYVTDNITKVATSFSDILKNFQESGLIGLLSGNKDKTTTFAQGVKAVAWLIIAMAAAIYVVASIPVDDLQKALIALGIAAGIIVGVILVLEILIKAFKIGKNITALKEGDIVTLFRDPLKAMAFAVDILAFGLIEIAAALWILSKTGLNPGDMLKYAAIISVTLLAVAAILAGMLALLNHIGLVDYNMLLTVAFSLDLVAIAIVGIAGSMWLLADATKDMTAGRMWAMAGLLTAVFLAMSIILGVLTWVTASYDILATAGAVLLMSIGFAIITEALTNVMKSIASNEKLDHEKLEDIIQLIKSFAVIFGLLAVVLGIVGAIPGVNLMEVGAVFAGLGVLLLGVAALLIPATLALEALTKLFFALFETFDVDSDGLEDKIKSIMKAIGSGLGGAISGFFSEMYLGSVDFLKEYIPKLFDYLGNTLLPEFVKFLNNVTPQMINNTLSNITAIFDLLTKYAPEAINRIVDFFYQVFFGFEDKSNAGLIETIFDWLDEFNERLIDRVVENIPTWVEGAYRIIMAFITSLADTLEENQEEIETNVTRLFDIMVEIGKNILESEDTGMTIREATSKMLSNLLIGVGDVFAGFGDAMRNLALHGLAEFLSGLSGQDVGFFEKILGLDEDSMNPVITPTLDLTNIRRGAKEMNGLFDTSSIDVSGIINSNNIPTTNIINSDTGNRLLEGLNDNMLNMNSSRDDHIDVNVTLETDKDRLFQIINQQSSIYNRAGYSY